MKLGTNVAEKLPETKAWHSALVSSREKGLPDKPAAGRGGWKGLGASTEVSAGFRARRRN